MKLYDHTELTAIKQRMQVHLTMSKAESAMMRISGKMISESRW